MEENNITSFEIGDKKVNGTLILEKVSLDKNEEEHVFQVFKLDDFDNDVSFEGTSQDLIQEEFPNHKFELGELVSTIFLMYKDGSPVGIECELD